MSGSRYYPTVNYPPFENTASADWVKKNKLSGKKAPSLPAARIVQFQAIDQLNSFLSDGGDRDGRRDCPPVEKTSFRELLFCLPRTGNIRFA